MKQLGIIFCFVLFLAACAEAVIEKPKNLILKDKMTDILYDMSVLQAMKATNLENLKELDEQMMPLIYKNHNIDSVQFVQSDLYYASMPATYQNIYKAVEKRLKEHQEALNEVRKRRNDSTRNNAEKSVDSIKKSKTPKKVGENLP